MTLENLDNRNTDCKIISIVSEKGGAGKTSLAYLLASAALKRGLRVHCIDADRNPQFLTWRGTTDVAHPDLQIEFPENLTASKLPDEPELADPHIAQVSHGADIVLIDNRPGRYEDIEDVAYSADVILIPGMPKAGEMKLLADTVLWMVEARDRFVDLKLYPPIKVVMLNASLTIMRAIEIGDEESLKALTDSDYNILNRFVEMPYMDTVIPNSRIIEMIPQEGPLSGYIDRAVGAQKPLANRILQISDSLLTEVLDLQPYRKGSNHG